VKSLRKQQRNDNSAWVPGIGELTYRAAEVGLGKIEVGRQRGDSRLLGHRRHQPLNAKTAIGMSAAVGESDQRGSWLAQGSASFAVRGMGLAAWAKFLQLKAIRIVTPVLLGDVIPLLALRTCQCDFWPDISGLGHDASSDL
jgi:hypothetical protein